MLTWVLLLILYRCHLYSCQPKFVNCLKSNSTDVCTTLQFNEELLPGTIVDVLTFNGNGSSMTFKITLKGTNILPFTYFSLNTRASDVDVVIGSRIDYEDIRANNRALYFEIEASAGGQKLTIPFYTVIIDIDDNYPVFQNMSYLCPMDELDQTEKCSGLMLSDQDLVNSIVYFRVVSSTSGSPSDFSIDKDSTQAISNTYVTTYTLSLNKPLNYDISKLIQVIVEAKDSANHTALNSININVIDVPSNPPIFQNLPYIVRIEEDLPLGSYVTIVSAVDGDKGINSPINYSFNDNIFNQYFSINTTSGIIRISKAIIRESSDIIQVYGVFNLSIIASKSNQNFSSQTTLNIQIIDINNYPTVFSQLIYYSSILENSRVGTTVYSVPQVATNDKDMDMNAQYSVSVLQNGNTSLVFDIFPKLGMYNLYLTLFVIDGQTLDYETMKHVNVTIQAKQITPVRNINSISEARVDISLIDVNDNVPQFTNSSYSISILENSPLLTMVGTITATDKDSGIFGTVYYFIVDRAKRFSINSTSGDLVVNVDASNNTTLLDREVTSSFTVIGQAIDGGGLVNSTTITINLIDVNDNPPIFQQKNYAHRLQENSMVFVPPILQVKANDADSNPFYTRITYSLISISNDSSNFLSSFAIDNSSGIITVVNSIDREALNQSNDNVLTIIVKASDPANPSFFDLCSINILVQDVNDNAPKLFTNVYSASISQNISKDMIIVSVNASDQDQINTMNSEISFRLIGSDATKFILQIVNSSLKAATISKDPNVGSLDIKTYNFTVEAADLGVPSLHGSAIVIINIISINSQNPVFNQTIYNFIIYENVPIGVMLGQVFATDNDIGSNLIYLLQLGQLKAMNSSGFEVQQMYNFTTTFAVNASTGILTVTGNLDRELADRIQFQVLVVDLAAQTLNQTATATISVTILDLNDNPPVFQSSVFYLNLLEDFSIASSITTGITGLSTVATDKDIVGVLRYNNSDASQSFVVDPVSGAITLIKGLDRENISFINFTVWCNDGIFSTGARIIVTVLDVNDNAPDFSGFISNISISQNAPVGTSLMKYSAIDADMGENARMLFNIDGGELVQFSLSSDGNLTLAKSLLQIPIQKYVIFIDVSDNPNGPYHLRSVREVNIYITLTNSPPVFDVPSAEYSIPENNVIGFKLDEITAVDKDFGDNGRITYYLLLPDKNPSSIALSLFRMAVNFNKAQIFLYSTLRYKAGRYILILRAMDNGSPRLDANYTMYINVTAINYNAPNFTNPVEPSANQSPPRFSINENIVAVITVISAYDPDEGVNGFIRYSLQDNDLDNSNFSIDSMNGTLVNKAPFDRETKDLYRCKIKANDLGTPSLTSYISIEVSILDLDDNPPTFQGVNKTIKLSIPEGPQGTSQINNTLYSGFKIGSVAMATDLDLDDNAKICYLMMKSISELYLAPYTGYLYGLRFFDVMVNSRYDFGIKAVPLSQCNSASLFINTNYVQTDPTEAMVTLFILDINNNPPFFTKPMIIERTPRFGLPGAVITDLSKYSGDPDVVSQGMLTYAIQGDISISSPLDNQLKAEKTGPSIILNSTSGIISIGQGVYYQISMQGYFQMTVVVSDGKFNATTAYMTYLVSQDQQVVLLIRDYPTNVSTKTDAIVSYFSQMSSAIIYIDGIEISTDIYMNIVIGSTNVYIYGFNASTNRVIDGNILLGMLGLKPANMAEMFNKYQIVNVTLAARNLSSSLDVSSLLYANTYRLVLIIICCIFAFILVITCAAIYLSRSNYHRQLKAFTTSSSDNTTVLKSMTLPGTNLYENSKNPFANSGIFENNSNDFQPNVKKYGAPIFGSGLTLERNIISMKGQEDSAQIIDSTETVF